MNNCPLCKGQLILKTKIGSLNHWQCSKCTEVLNENDLDKIRLALQKQAKEIFKYLRFADVKYNSNYDFIEIPLKVFEGLEKKYGG